MNTLRVLRLGLLLAGSSAFLVSCSSKSANPVATNGTTEHQHHTDGSHAGQAEHPDHGDHKAHQGHESASAQLIVSSKPDKPLAGSKTALHLMVHDAAGKMIKDFEVNHEKLAHLIIVRLGLDEFAHLHPDVDPQGNMTVEHTFPIGGEYLIFLDYKPAGGSPATAKAKINVEGDTLKAPELVANVPGTMKSGKMQAAVSVNKESKGAVVTFDVKDEKGQPANDLQPYLGAMGHLVVISADGQRYVHAHPLTDKPGAPQVKFEVHFPGPGLYKTWGQFQKDNEVFTIPAVVQVSDADHA